MINPQALCQIEIAVSDMEQSLAFYEQVFGWTSVSVDIQGYVVMEVPQSCPYGIALVRAHDKAATSISTLYFRVENAAAIVERAKQFGAPIRLGPKKLPGYGSIYQIVAPDGQVYGIFQAD